MHCRARHGCSALRASTGRCIRYYMWVTLENSSGGYVYIYIHMELQRRMFADCRFRIWGFIFQGSHFRFLGTAIVSPLPNLGFRVWGMLDAWVLFCGFRVYSFTCFGFRVSDIVFEHSSFMFQVTDFCILIRSCRFPILHFVVCCLHVRFPI